MSSGSRPRGMGRGLAAILAVSTPGEGEAEELREIAVGLIEPNPRQPRRRFDEESLQALSRSLGTRGVLQPVLVRPKAGGTFELIAGERRWRAATIAGMDRIPALVRQRGDQESLEIALIENMAREDLNPVEEARACAALVEELSLSREDVGLRVGRSRVAVSNLMRLLDLPDEVLTLLERGQLSEGHGRALMLTTNHDERKRLARDAVAEGWSVRVLEQRARAAGQPAGIVPPRGYRGGSRALHPDQLEACERIGDALGSAFGAEVTVTVGRDGAYHAGLRIESVEDAMALAQRLRPRAVA